MADITIASGVLVNDDVSTTSRFTTVTLSSSGTSITRQTPQTIIGMASLVQPITFEFFRPVRQKIKDDLLAIAATFVARPARRTIAGFSDAILNDGAELCLFSWTERDRPGSTTDAQSQWGYFQIVTPTVRGLNETVSLVLYPVDRVRFVNSSTFLTRPGVT